MYITTMNNRHTSHTMNGDVRRFVGWLIILSERIWASSIQPPIQVLVVCLTYGTVIEEVGVFERPTEREIYRVARAEECLGRDEVITREAAERPKTSKVKHHQDEQPHWKHDPRRRAALSGLFVHAGMVLDAP